jgi:hypothetical protein
MLHVISRNDGRLSGISRARLTVFEGGKGKPAAATALAPQAAPAPMLLLAGPSLLLAPPASLSGADSPHTTGATRVTSGPQPNPWVMELPATHPQW